MTSRGSAATTEGPAGAAGVLPDGLRIYAVGDIHGRFDLLEVMSANIRRDLQKSRAPRAIEIFLGDYIDRGQDSRAVLEWLSTSKPLTDGRICLMGNHEDLMLRAIADPQAMPGWLYNDGTETIASYLVGTVEPPDLTTVGGIRNAFLAAFPERHRAFVSGLKRMVTFGGYIFVHAGLNPLRPIDDQDPEDLIWIREPFLSSEVDFGKIVVHGHTPVKEPEIRRNGINIDTGAVFSGHLTCLVLEGAKRRFLET